jgi:hypothetical protein
MTESKTTKVESSPTIFNGIPQKKGYKNRQQFIPRASKFIGRNHKIKNNFFDVPDGRNADQFSKTLESIAEYILKEYKNNMACSQAIRDMVPATLEESRITDDLIYPVKLAIFDEEVRECVKDKKSFKDIILGQCNVHLNLIGTLRDLGRMAI